MAGDSGSKTITHDERGGPFEPTAPQLLVILDESSFRRTLPWNGAVVVGRGAEADLVIDHASISRRHAKLLIAEGEVSITDLGSHNGTRVNGDRAEGTRILSSGDVIGVGEAELILRGAARPRAREVLDAARMRRRIQEEIEHASDRGRALSVLVLAFGEVRGDLDALAETAAAAIQGSGIVGWGRTVELVILLPELTGQGAEDAGDEILDALAKVAPKLRGGLASFPADGPDADTLLAGARAAVEIAGPGSVSPASEAVVRYTFGDDTVVLADRAMIRSFELIRRIASRDLAIPVLILGETGSGKEMAAAAVHYWSPRAKKRYVTQNCALLGELLESELFGHEKGAFTDAKQAKPGLFEEANGGTVFLDEVGDLPLAAQAKLLRVLDGKPVKRVGGHVERLLDIRIVAATNIDLEAEIKRGRFREDLYFRLKALTVELLPLRERPRDLPILARHFADKARAAARLPPAAISDAAMDRILRYGWRGNLRELRDAMQVAAAHAEGDVIESRDLPSYVRAAEEGEPAPPGDPARRSPFKPLAQEIQELELLRIKQALEASQGVRFRAAELLGMPLRTFVFKLRQYGLSRARTPRSS
jgi:two-component system, NtrC family, response regulator AtoC